MANDTLARQKARAVGKVITGLLLNDPSEAELRVINELSDATVKRRIRTLYIPADSGLIKKIEGAHPEILLAFHEGWVEFFKKFGIEIDLAKFLLKPYSEGRDWSIIDPNPESFFYGWEIAKQVMPVVHEYIMVKNIMDVYPYEPVVTVRPLIEAMEEFPNVSTRQSIQRGIKGITFNQYCMLASRIWVDQKIHLDDKSVTICSGSRSEDGNPVRVYWDGGKFQVYNLPLGNSYDNYSVRSAV
ncbi:MAG: hypothetical protein WC662_01130 [Candidatus Paceibacterota bacterium]|jgi:hypothetical protein